MKDVAISTTIFGPKGMEVKPLEFALDGIAEAGWRWIEISRKHNSMARHTKAIEARGLEVWAVHGTLGFDSISSDEAVRREEVEKERARLEDAAPFAPCPYVVHYLDRVRDPRGGENFRRSIEELLQRAEALSLDLAVETVPDKPGNERFPDSREVADFVRSFDSPFVSVCLDLNHSNLGEDLAQAAASCAGLISNIHVSDNHGEEEEHLIPGEGAIDFDAALRAVSDAGYAGPVNLEVHVPRYPTRDDLIRMRRWAEAAVSR